jgi:hypothetical protein
MRFTLNV